MHGAAKWPHSFMARSPTLGATCFGHLDLGRRFLDPSPSGWGITWGIILPWGTTDGVLGLRIRFRAGRGCGVQAGGKFGQRSIAGAS